MLDLLIRLTDDQVTEVCGYWANQNHPYVEVEDSAVAIPRFARGGLGSIARSSRACRRSREFTPRSTSTGPTEARSASRPTAARHSSRA
ncbi:MAG: hypothetical protein WBX00_33985 [Isosphaeraceae bacterium]